MISADLGIGRILVRGTPGAFSAHEMLMTDAYQERSLTRITSVAGTTAAELERVLNT
jgi:hypothetical protein